MELSFHLQEMFQQAVDFLKASLSLITTFWSSALRAESSFYDQQMILTIDTHFHQHHTGHTWILQWCKLQIMLSCPQWTPLDKDMYPWQCSDWIYQSDFHWCHVSVKPVGLQPCHPLSGAISWHLIIGPPLYGYLWLFIQNGECTNIMCFVIIWIILVFGAQ